MSHKIEKAERKGNPALICLWGPSGSGKTYSALKLARGLVGPKGKIGMIDTENRRGEFYANMAGGWYHLDLQPPFTPQRYTDALKTFEDAGDYGCVIIDSKSHAWEGEGGVLDMADAMKTRNGEPMQGLAKWKAPKMAYKRMVNNDLRAPFHVIFCLRSKDGVRQNGRGQNAEIESTGVEPVSGKGFIYEMTVSALIGPDHKPVFANGDHGIKCNALIPTLKAPEDLIGAFKPGQYLSEETGAAIATWVGGGAVVDHAAEKIRKVARDVATLGTDPLRDHWKTLDKAGHAALALITEELKSIAAQADQERAEQDGDNDKVVDDGPFNDGSPDPFATGKPPPPDPEKDMGSQ